MHALGLFEGEDDCPLALVLAVHIHVDLVAYLDGHIACTVKEFACGYLPFGFEADINQNIVVTNPDDFSFDDGTYFDLAKVGG